MIEPEVEAVIVNYKRPDNIGRILEVLKSGTVKPLITLIDCSPQSVPRLSDNVLAMADNVYTSRENRGGWNRLVPFWNLGCCFTYFHDDDYLPGIETIEYCLNWNHRMRPCGVLGLGGKSIVDGKYGKYVERKIDPVRVDVVLHTYFVRTTLLNLLLQHKNWFMKIGGLRGVDILMCAATQMVGYPSYVLPIGSSEEEINKIVPDNDALWRGERHFEIRQNLIDEMIKRGWRTCEARNRT